MSPHLVFIAGDKGRCLGRVEFLQASTHLLVLPSAIWGSNFTAKWSEPPLGCHEEPTCGRLAREGTTVARLTTAFCLGRARWAPQAGTGWLGVCLDSLTPNVGPPIRLIGQKGVVLDWGLCVLTLEVCFSLITPAYKYLPTLLEIVSNKPLPLGWSSSFMHLCRIWWPKICT